MENTTSAKRSSTKLSAKPSALADSSNNRLSRRQRLTVHSSLRIPARSASSVPRPISPSPLQVQQTQEYYTPARSAPPPTQGQTRPMAQPGAPSTMNGDSDVDVEIGRVARKYYVPSEISMMRLGRLGRRQHRPSGQKAQEISRIRRIAIDPDTEIAAQQMTDPYWSSKQGYETPSESGGTPAALDLVKPSLKLEHVSEPIAEDCEEDEKTADAEDSDFGFDSDGELLADILGIVANHFFEGDDYLNPRDIAALNQDLKERHADYVVAFHALNQVLSGGVYFGSLSNEDHARIEALLRCHQSVPKQVAQWNRSLNKERTTVALNLTDLVEFFPSMASLLHKAKPSERVRCVNLDALVSVFPKCQNLSVIAGFNKTTENSFGFQLDAHVFDTIIEMLSRKDCPLRRIQFDGQDEESLSKRLAQGVYAKKFLKIGWRLTCPLASRTTLLLQKKEK